MTSPVAHPGARGLGGRVVRGGTWLVALGVLSWLLAAVRVLILARFLAPHDFGLVAAAAAAVSLVESFSAPGTQLALIHRAERTRSLFDTAWTVGVFRGGVVAGLLAFAAPAVGRFFDAPDVVPVLRALALLPVLRGLTNIGVVEFRQELTFGPHVALHASGVVAELCVAVPLALWLGDARALIGGWLALAAVQAAMSYALHPYRPRLRLVGRELRALLGYGRWVLVSMAIRWLLADGVHALVGKLVGVHALGLYSMASRVAAVPTSGIVAVSGVTVGAYAKLQGDAERVRDAYMRVLTAVAVVAVPAGVVLALFADDLVRVLLGAQWAGVVPSLRVLALAGVVRCVSAPAVPLFQGVGRPERQTLAATVELGVVVVLALPLTTRMGPLGAALTVGAAAAAGAAVSATAVCRLVGVRVPQLTLRVLGPLLASAPVVAFGIWATGLSTTVGQVAAALLACGVLYLSSLLLLGLLKLYPLDTIVPTLRDAWAAR